MKMVAFIFSHAPHGTSFGREGLDAVFGISSIIQNISLFFIGDGVFQLLKSCQSKSILTRNYVPAFSILSLYDIKNFYCCRHSLIERGLGQNSNFILKINILDLDNLRLELDKYDAIINF